MDRHYIVGLAGQEHRRMQKMIDSQGEGKGATILQDRDFQTFSSALSLFKAFQDIESIIILFKPFQGVARYLFENQRSTYTKGQQKHSVLLFFFYRAAKITFNYLYTSAWDNTLKC